MFVCINRHIANFRNIGIYLISALILRAHCSIQLSRANQKWAPSAASGTQVHHIDHIVVGSQEQTKQMSES